MHIGDMQVTGVKLAFDSANGCYRLAAQVADGSVTVELRLPPTLLQSLVLQSVALMPAVLPTVEVASEAEAVRLPARVLPHGGRVGGRFVRAFGTERFDFIGAHDEAIGYHETCALFSPMGGFTDQALARATAREALALTRPQPQPATPTVLPARRAFFLGRGGERRS